MVASIFDDSPAALAGLPAKSVVTKIDGVDIIDLEGFEAR